MKFWHARMPVNVIGILLLFNVTLKGQVLDMRFTPVDPSGQQDSILSSHFDAYRLVAGDWKTIHSILNAVEDPDSIRLEAKDFNFVFNLKQQKIKSSNYCVKVLTKEGIQNTPASLTKTYAGRTREGFEVRMTVDTGYFAVSIYEKEDVLIIEPLNRFIKEASSTHWVAYYALVNRAKVPEGNCGTGPAKDTLLPAADLHRSERDYPVCKEVEIALANDWLMYSQYGSIAAIENHNLTVLNNVQTNYDTEFDFDLLFEVVEIFIVTTQGGDPWTTSTDPATLLSSFTSWGSSGFSQPHDEATLWTDRDMDGTTVGYAWINSVCGNNRYNVCQDFTTNANFLRVLQAHELGHNFSCQHDAENSGFIMAPSINNTNLWSASSISSVDAKVSSVTCLSPCCDNPNAPNMEGDYTIGNAGDYINLKTAATELFLHGMSGNTTFRILENIVETESVEIKQWSNCDNGNYSLTIKPAVSTTPLISGNVTSALLLLNGADNVVINGSNNGTNSKDLTIRNTSTTGSTIRFMNDATNNILKNVKFEGSAGLSSNATISFSTSSGGVLGNSNNLIHNCTIRDRSDAGIVPSSAIYASGTSSAPNSNNTINQCEIFNWINNGVIVASLGSGNGWTIDSCHFYQTAPRTNTLSAITILGGHGHTISKNKIGGTTTGAQGSFLATSNTFRGIDLLVGTTSTTQVFGNVIKNIRSTYDGTSPSYGIYLQLGLANIGGVEGNTIGSADVNERFEVNGHSTALYISSTSDVTISNNSVDHFQTTENVSSGQSIYGLSIHGSMADHIVSNNIVRNIFNYSMPNASNNSQTFGMNISASGILTVQGNLIENIGSMTTAAPTALNNRVWGMILSGSAPGSRVEKNTLYNAFGSSAGTGDRADQIYGIFSHTTANAIYANNMISLNGGANSERRIIGIINTANTPVTGHYYHNTVNIYGTATATSFTYAFNRSGTAVVTLRNNIFSNSRTGGSGWHVAIANSNVSATGWSPTASDYNLLYNINNNHIGSWLNSARTFTQWKAAQNATPPGSGGDANSWVGIPGFSSNADLHIDPTSYMPNNTGLFLNNEVENDIDGALRDTLYPDIGADEYLPGPCISAVVSTNKNTGPGSLRQMIECALQGSTITFLPVLSGDSVTLTSEIKINKNLTLLGLGINQVSVSGSELTRLFHLLPGKTFTVQNISLADGFRSSQGGAIWIEGTLILENVRLENNYDGPNPRSFSTGLNASIQLYGSVELKD